MGPGISILVAIVVWLAIIATLIVIAMAITKVRGVDGGADLEGSETAA